MRMNDTRLARSMKRQGWGRKRLREVPEALRKTCGIRDTERG